jgi:hypothetical protein
VTRARGVTTFALAASLCASLAAPSLAHAWCRTTTQRSSMLGECSTSGTPLAWQSLCTGFSMYIDGSPELSLDDVRSEATTAAARWHMAA